MFLRLLMILFVLGSVTQPASPALAGGVVGVCDEDHLMAALSGGGTVTFTCSGTITLTNTILISEDTIIDGSGQNVTISGGDAVRLFTVGDGKTLRLNELAISRGHADHGGGIYTEAGFIYVSNSTFSNNRATERGGGIYSYCCTVSVVNSTFAENSAASGGGIFSLGLTVTISNSVFTGNSATISGGGIYNYQVNLTVAESTFSANHSNGRGGAIFTDAGSLDLEQSLFSGNRASNGAGIYLAGTSTRVSTSTFSANPASGDGGGGIYNEGGALHVEACTFTGNSAPAGGGIYNTNSFDYVDARASVKNSTFSGNMAAAHGGGIFNYDATGQGAAANVSSSTFSGNSAPTGHGGGIYTDQDTVNLGNTILAGNPGGNCSGTITSMGGNLSYPDPSCPGINGNPSLGPLQDNGGPTQTMAPAPGSPAIEAGNAAQCPATDQRGVTRPVDGDGDGEAICDIGSFEYQPPEIHSIYFPLIRRHAPGSGGAALPPG